MLLLATLSYKNTILFLKNNFYFEVDLSQEMQCVEEGC